MYYGNILLQITWKIKISHFSIFSTSKYATIVAVLKVNYFSIEEKLPNVLVS